MPGYDFFDMWYISGIPWLPGYAYFDIWVILGNPCVEYRVSTSMTGGVFQEYLLLKTWLWF